MENFIRRMVGTLIMEVEVAKSSERKDQISQALTLKSSEQIPHTTLVENATQTERGKHVNRC